MTDERKAELLEAIYRRIQEKNGSGGGAKIPVFPRAPRPPGRGTGER